MTGNYQRSVKSVTTNRACDDKHLHSSLKIWDEFGGLGKLKSGIAYNAQNRGNLKEPNPVRL